MAGFGPIKWDPESVPPFWLPEDDRIHPHVRSVAEGSWSWAFWLIKRQLNDGTRTGEIVEDVAVEVSNRFCEDANVGKNLKAYFKTALKRHVLTLVVRESRISYEGGAQDLEANYHPQASDWTKALDDKRTLRKLLPYLSCPVRQILHYRLTEFSWKKIGKVLDITEKQAKSRYYYGLHQACQDLLAAQARRARQEEN